jgi:DNA-binding NtrC family response regulator
VPELIAGLRVLVVDDTAPIRDLLSNYFQKRGMTVTAVADGTAGIQALERTEGRFDLVVTDLHMPGADGFAVLVEARRLNPKCPVVIITGYATLDSAIQAVRVGAYDYLPKPFSLGEVEELLNRIAMDRLWNASTPAPDSPASVDQLASRVRQLEARLASLETPGLIAPRIADDDDPDGFPTRD